METGAAKPQTKVFERSEKTAGPSRPASQCTARPERSEGQPQKNRLKKTDQKKSIKFYLIELELAKKAGPTNFLAGQIQIRTALAIYHWNMRVFFFIPV